jgi:peptide/nickel transport system substrate-binding protein
VLPRAGYPAARPVCIDIVMPCTRRAFVQRALAGGAVTAPWWPARAQPSAAAKVLRYAFPTSETGFDPAQISDLYSRTVTPHIFEALYAYDPLARPVKVRPCTAAAMPEVSDDFRVWTVRLVPGIVFADDPAFKGQRRELVAADYVYSFKRLFDPALKSPSYSTIKDEGILGLEELRQQSIAAKQPFDYDRAVEGLRALDRYTLQFRLAESRPRFINALAAGDIFGAMAREVVEAYGERIAEHPVGTGPFRLARWRRSSLIVLERNPNFRDQFYAAEPAADDAAGQAIAARLRGRRLPMIDRVEISIIDEAQPRWLAFLNDQHDLLQVVPLEFAEMAVPGGKLAPNLAKRDIGMQRQVNPDTTLTVYNMEDPVVGGYTPQKVALRRALNLAYDVEREITVVRHGQAVPAQSCVPPHTFGYDPRYRSENSLFDLARAKALLDLYGYVDRNGDGWREQPDGSPLAIELSSPPDQVYRLLTEVRKKSLDALGVRLTVRIGNWAEQLKAARAGNFMVWTVGSSASTPDGQGALERDYGPASGAANLARFRLAAFDRLYERMKGLPDGPERQALFTEANNLLIAYAPYKVHVHRIVTDLWQPWLVGYRRPLFWQDFWQYVDVDMTHRPPAR